MGHFEGNTRESNRISHINIEEKGNVLVSSKLRVDSLNLIERTKNEKKGKTKKFYGKLATLAIDT